MSVTQALKTSYEFNKIFFTDVMGQGMQVYPNYKLI